MRALAELTTRNARAVVLAALVLVVGGGAWASGVTDRLTTGGNDVPGSESVRAAMLLDERDGSGTPNLIVLVRADRLDDAEVEQVTEAIERTVVEHGAELLGSHLGPDSDDLRSTDGTAGLVIAHLPGDDEAVQASAADLAPKLRELATESVEVSVGGTGPARAELIEQTEADLVTAELIAVPITLLVLLFVFRTAVAAVLPLVVAVAAIIGTLIALRVLVAFTSVSVFAQNVMTALGLAMAIDFTLFLVSRYRELRPRSSTAREAVTDAVVAAGPSILFSGLTTAASLAGLLVFETPMLRSFAYAGVAVVLVAIVGALVVLPAVMTLLDDRLDRWRVRPVALGTDPTRGRWYRMARRMMRRPALVAVSTIAVLLLVAAPFTRIEFGLNDDRVLPADAEPRQVLDAVRSEFAGIESGAVSVVFEDPAAGSPLAVEAYARELRSLPGVARIEERDGWLRVIPSVEPVSPDGRRLVEAIRSTPAPTPVLVGGDAARLVDNTDHVTERLPFVLGGMILATTVLLGVLFRSVLVPLKAVALNLLSLSAMFGAIVWIFQDGRFSGVLDYTPTGLTDITIPTLMFCVAFGLSMDYEVFLLSRIREEYDRTGDPVDSVAVGLQRTGGVLSASATLMAVVFTAFATGSVTQLKILGIGLTLAVLLDAFVVRSLLVPSLMRLAGRANWWPSRPRSDVRGGRRDGGDRAVDLRRADVDDDRRDGATRDPAALLLPRGDR